MEQKTFIKRLQGFITYLQNRLLHQLAKAIRTPHVDRGFASLITEMTLSICFFQYIHQFKSDTYPFHLFVNSIFYQTVCTANKTIKLTYYHLGVYTADDASKLDKFESDFLYWVFTILDDGYSLWTCYFVYSYVYLFFYNDGAF